MFLAFPVVYFLDLKKEAKSIDNILWKLFVVLLMLLWEFDKDWFLFNLLWIKIPIICLILHINITLRLTRPF